MRILLVTQFFAPDITAAAFRLTDFARILAADRGHDLHVLTAHPHKAQLIAVDDTVFEDLGISLHRCHVKEVAGEGAKAYLRHYLSFVRGSLVQGVKLWWSGWRPDVIYVSSPPLFVGLTGKLLSILFRRPMVFEVRDIWPDTAVAAGQLSPTGRAYRIGRRLEKYLYQQARHLVCVSAPMRAYLTRESTTPVTVVYNGVSSGLTHESSKNDLPDHHHPRRLVYAGNVGHLQELDLLLQGFLGLCHEGRITGWQLIIVGTGAQLQKLKDLVVDEQAQSLVVFRGALSREDAQRQMESADLLYMNLKHNPTLEKTIPSKLFDYLSAARPIIAGLSGEGKEILESTGANVVFAPGDLRALRQALLDAVERRTTLVSVADRNRQLVLDRFSREQAAQTLESVLESVVRN